MIGWGDGEWAWSAEDWDRFPGAFRQTVVGDPDHDGDWLDVEHFLADVTHAPGWVQRQRARDPLWPGGVYTTKDDTDATHGWPALASALVKAGVSGVRLWIASELGALPPAPVVIMPNWLELGVVLWQYALSPGISPGHYDLSAIAPSYLPAAPDPLAFPPFPAIRRSP